MQHHLSRLIYRCLCITTVWVFLSLGVSLAQDKAEAPNFVNYCNRLAQDIQGRKHAFLAGNLSYYIGGFHPSWELAEQETLGLTHPFFHDLRSRGVGLFQSQSGDDKNTGIGNDLSGWEFYKDTRVLYGSVILENEVHKYPVPSRMQWRPDRVICEYEVGGVRLHEEKFIAENDVACSIVRSSSPIRLRFDGQSFYGRHSQSSSASIAFDGEHNVICITEGGTTKCIPDVDRNEQVAPIMYEGMTTVIGASRSISESCRFSSGEHGQCQYEFEVPCDANGVVLVWAMDDRRRSAIQKAISLLGEDAKQAMDQLQSKERLMNRQLNEEVPYFRCSDSKFEDIYYYLWSLYLMYYIEVGKGMEVDAHTQTAVNNFLGMHRYDAAFQIRVGAWLKDRSRYAYGNVLTWKRLFTEGFYRRSPNGAIALADNKGTTWHSAIYGNELSEHVLGAWQIYLRTGDVEFLHQCYEGYFREIFWKSIPPFYSNHFEVAETLGSMAQLTGNDKDVLHWQQLVLQDNDRIRAWFDQRWEAHGHHHYFAGPADGMLMTTGFWHLRSKHFPSEYARDMIQTWALDPLQGFAPETGRPFPLAMSRKATSQFNTSDDQAFGYTPDTAYFLLDGLFRQSSRVAADLTVNHLEHYNFSERWNLPVAPEAYRRDGRLFGDQYSNFNAGKLLLYLEGLGGLTISVPDRKLKVQPRLPSTWDWMEFRLPIEERWTRVRVTRDEVTVSGCPYEVDLAR